MPSSFVSPSRLLTVTTQDDLFRNMLYFLLLSLLAELFSVVFSQFSVLGSWHLTAFLVVFYVVKQWSATGLTTMKVNFIYIANTVYSSYCTIVCVT